jgi:hypothetical protein
MVPYEGLPLWLLSHTRFWTGRQLTGGARAQLGTLIASPILINRSNDQER